MSKASSPEQKDVTELQDYWNRYVEIYSKHHARFTAIIQYGILNNLQLTSARRVLEVGAGPGNDTPLLIQQLFETDPDSKQLLTSDYSPDMVERLREAVRSAAQKYKITVQVLDARKLPFPDASFDRYFAGLCIQLVPEYETCIQEAARVLSKGGIAGFSVWGREANCTQITFPKDVVKEVLADEMPKMPEKQHSNFDCGRDPQHVVDMCKRAGFSRVVYWYSSACSMTGFSKADVPVALGSVIMHGVFDKLPEAIRQDRVQKIERRLMERLSDGIDGGNKPLVFEALCVVAMK